MRQRGLVSDRPASLTEDTTGCCVAKCSGARQVSVLPCHCLTVLSVCTSKKEMSICRLDSNYIGWKKALFQPLLVVIRRAAQNIAFESSLLIHFSNSIVD